MERSEYEGSSAFGGGMLSLLLIDTLVPVSVVAHRLRDAPIDVPLGRRDIESAPFHFSAQGLGLLGREGAPVVDIVNKLLA